MNEVKDRVALIAGAANDLGEGIGLRLGKNGARLALVDPDSDKLNRLVEKMAGSGFQAEGFVADQGKPSEIKKTVDNVVDKLGAIDILVNCMDFKEFKPVGESSFEDWEALLKMNLSPIFLFCEEVAPRMVAGKYGRIINLSDINYIGMPGKAAYAAVKSAVFGFTRALALELAKHAITVNTVVKGDMQQAGVELSEEDLSRAVGPIAVKHLGSPDDVAYAVNYFAADTSRYVTGQTLFVCGGKSVHSSMTV